MDRSLIGKIWDRFWSNGLTNPLTVIEHMTFLLFLKRIDESQILEEKRSNDTGTEIRKTFFPNKLDQFGKPISDLRWSNFKNKSPNEILDIISNRTIPYIANELRSDFPNFSEAMDGANWTFKGDGKAEALDSIIALIDSIEQNSEDTLGDIYENMLKELSTAKAAGQYRTPTHIIRLMVEMISPTSGDRILDPACGTSGFLASCIEYFKEKDQTVFETEENRNFYNNEMFNGSDSDPSMIRISNMNLMLHGIEKPNIINQDSLSKSASNEKDIYDLILANPPFSGSLEEAGLSKDLQLGTNIKSTELLFVSLFLKRLRNGGRCAFIIKDTFLSGGTTLHKELRKNLIEEHKLEGIITLPSGIFKPYSGVSTCIVIFTKTNSGGTDNVWYYDLQSDGYSLDDKRNALLEENKLGPNAVLSSEEHKENNLPDVLKRWKNKTKESSRLRTDQSFLVPKEEIENNEYDLNLNLYKEFVYEEIIYDPPEQIISNLLDIEKDVQKNLHELNDLLKND